MNTNAVPAFRKLTTAFEQLEQLATRMPLLYRSLADRSSQRHGEEQRSHSAVMDQISALITHLQQVEQDQIAQADLHTARALQEYQQTIENSTNSITGALDIPRRSTDALREIMLTSLYKQWQELSALNEAESGADVTRITNLGRYHAMLQKASKQFEDILAALYRANVSSTAAVQTEYSMETEHYVRQGVALNQQAVKAYYQGFSQTALALLEQAARLAPGDVTILLNLAQLYLEMGQIEQAAEAQCKAAHLAPQSAQVLYIEGVLALKQGDTRRAVETLSRCVDAVANPTDQLPYRLALAEAYYLDGHPQQAVEQWHRVLAIEPMHPTAHSRLQFLE